MTTAEIIVYGYAYILLVCLLAGLWYYYPRY